jgi:hypothetical protein
MEKEINSINFEYSEVKRTSKIMKFTSYILMMIFIFNPLSEFVDVFRKASYICWCQLPCLDPFYFYNFL